ncbi:Putative Ca2+/H+ antiporter, TMEM165/GDT1 family [Hydrocarboniphaga daqingensis]|uniref:GDT1 family protein n=1 Tax=Hydrocarboniphaga daqingensis TaxID=490188 RepID=A0A1M5PWK6_9GAMM|nr:TMEM165/GDT1 family protein [Hydrocarboniphaga daqingensis]SHH06050.1 Putative Ca2+/H+ antiporter, TMEM165/GDT1 family [Hydrocarboniphaga daqingensis]
MIFEAFTVCTSVVALAEMGDKTQLLSLCLAARYRKPLPIVLGILVATLLNHGLAGWLGAWVATHVPETYLRWALGLSFIAMAGWLLVPDRFDDADDSLTARRGTIFLTTLWLFFIAEIGDKTQIATIGLAMRYDSLLAVVAGTTLGMMLANVPAVFLGDRFARRMPADLMRRIAAAVFAVIGLLMLLGVGDGL